MKYVGKSGAGASLSVFERYLTVWVSCIVAGIVAGLRHRGSVWHLITFFKELGKHLPGSTT